MEDYERVHLLDSIYLEESKAELEMKLKAPEFGVILTEGLKIKKNEHIQNFSEEEY